MTPKARTWIVDLRHYLDDETGELADMPAPALNCALYFGSIVAWVSDHMPGGEPHTNVPCWRRPGRKRCLGEIVAEPQSGSSDILWHCPVCGEQGMIRGWEDTRWSRPGRL